MIDGEAVLTEVRQALRAELSVDFDRQLIRLVFAGGELLLSGEVDSIAAKKQAVARAATVPLVATVIDEMCVRPKVKMLDGEIRDLLRNALLQEPTLAGCIIREGVRGGFKTLRTPPYGRRANRLQDSARRHHAGRRGSEPLAKAAVGRPRLADSGAPQRHRRACRAAGRE